MISVKSQLSVMGIGSASDFSVRNLEINSSKPYKFNSIVPINSFSGSLHKINGSDFFYITISGQDELILRLRTLRSRADPIPSVMPLVI